VKVFRSTFWLDLCANPLLKTGCGGGSLDAGGSNAIVDKNGGVGSTHFFFSPFFNFSLIILPYSIAYIKYMSSSIYYITIQIILCQHIPI
jgi:hypothetical protein